MINARLRIRQLLDYFSDLYSNHNITIEQYKIISRYLRYIDDDLADIEGWLYED